MRARLSRRGRRRIRGEASKKEGDSHEISPGDAPRLRHRLGTLHALRRVREGMPHESSEPEGQGRDSEIQGEFGHPGFRIRGCGSLRAGRAVIYRPSGHRHLGAARAASELEQDATRGEAPHGAPAALGRQTSQAHRLHPVRGIAGQGSSILQRGLLHVRS